MGVRQRSSRYERVQAALYNRVAACGGSGVPPHRLLRVFLQDAFDLHLQQQLQLQLQRLAPLVRVSPLEVPRMKSSCHASC